MENLSELKNIKKEPNDFLSSDEWKIPTEMQMTTVKEENDHLLHSEIDIKTEEQEYETELPVFAGTSYETYSMSDTKFEMDKSIVNIERVDQDVAVKDPLDVNTEIAVSMPPKKKPKTDINPTDCCTLLAAIKMVKVEKKSIAAVARYFGLARRSLCRYVAKINRQFPATERNFSDVPHDEAISFLMSISMIGGKTVLSHAQERALVSYIIKCSKLNYGLSINNIRSLAYEFAKRMDVEYPASWNANARASRHWYYGFMGRHPNLSLRKPQPLSAYRSAGFCKEAVAEFFWNYKEVLDKYKFTPDRIWNMDEIGFPTVPKKPVNVIAQRGVRQVSIHSHTELGTNVTFALAVNAAGIWIPPFFLFPCANWRDYFLDNCPPGSVGYANKLGWMEQKNFLDFLPYFIQHAKPTKADPVLLLMDNHSSHISVDIIDMCMENGIEVVTFPPHCSHRLQPLDVGVFGPVKYAYSIKYHEWTQSNVNHVFEIHHVVSIVDKALIESCTQSNIRSGFERTGVFPVNSRKFTDDDFNTARISAEYLMAAKTTDDPDNRRNILVVDENS